VILQIFWYVFNTNNIQQCSSGISEPTKTQSMDFQKPGFNPKLNKTHQIELLETVL